MKRLPLNISLLILATIAIMATVGASAASAKVCSTSGAGESCGGAHGNLYTGKLVASLSTPSVSRFVSGFATWTCGASTLEGEITNALTGTGGITAWTFGDCHSNLNTTSGSCTLSTSASSTNKWPTSVAVTTAPNGTMTVQNITTVVACQTGFGSFTCRYSAAKAATTVNGSDTAPTVVVTNVALSREEVSNGLCSATATWSGTYTLTTPNSLFMT